MQTKNVQENLSDCILSFISDSYCGFYIFNGRFLVSSECFGLQKPLQYALYVKTADYRNLRDHSVQIPIE